jgi:type IV pilus assembly protein PilP
MRLIKPMLGAAGVALALLGLTGCGLSDQQELQQWMTEQRNATRPNVPPLTKPTKFTPEIYTQEGAVDPFSSQKLTQALIRDSSKATANVALITPELNRRKEPLEASPLDTIVMVGSLIKAGQPVALVRVDKLIYQVRVGNYLGQNYGLIKEVTESGIVLREIVQDAAGEWTERMANLQLSEEVKK